MPEIEFFTVTAHLQSINVDYVDAGEDPDVQNVSSTVTFLPRIGNGALIWAPGLTVPSGVALSPVVARTDTDGILRTIQNAPVNERQSITVNGTPTSYKLSLDGTNKTIAIAGNASSTTLDSALESLAAVGAGNVTVSGPTGSPPVYTVSFVGDLSATNVGQLVSSDLVGGSTPSVVVATTQTGSLMGGVKLVANTPAVDLDELIYDVKFDNVVFNKADQVLSPFAFEAPTSGGVTVDLSSVNKLEPKTGL